MSKSSESKRRLGLIKISIRRLYDAALPSTEAAVSR